MLSDTTLSKTDEKEKLKRAADEAVFQISKLSSRWGSSSALNKSEDEDMLAPPSFEPPNFDQVDVQHSMSLIHKMCDADSEGSSDSDVESVSRSSTTAKQKANTIIVQPFRSRA